MVKSTGLDGTIRPITKSEPPLSNDTEIEAVAKAVLAGTHPYKNWTHMAHCASTVYLLIMEPDRDLEVDMPDIIKSYNTAIGVSNTEHSGYHHTVTLFYIAAIRSLLQPGMSLIAALNAVRDSGMVRREYILEFYSAEVLFSPNARLNWVEPDLKAAAFLG